MAHVDPRIFRTYDIRGIVDQAMTEETVYYVGQALGSEMLVAGETQIVLGRDGRLSGERFAHLMSEGLRSTGIKVIDLGAVMTPMVYFAAETLPGGHSCVVITGSHNPPDYNGIKMVIDGVTLYGEHIQKLLQRIQNDDFVESARPGDYQTYDIFPAYRERILSGIALKRPLKVVVDAGNGIAGAFAPEIIEALGCDVTAIFCEVDGSFPNHHPDPAKLKNLQDLAEKVVALEADVGLAFDGDGDRCGVVDNRGEALYPDRQMMLYAQDVLTRQPGAEVIYDIKCTALLPKVIEAAGGHATMWKTGHSYMKAKMRESGAALGGEVSGHMFFKERWYGFDDGVYTAARMLEILSTQSQTAAALFAALPNAYNTPEIDIPFEEGQHYAFMEKIKAVADFSDAKVFDLDGLRVDFEDGWGLIRPSNTSPVIVLRFEGETPEALARIQQRFKVLMLSVDPSLTLPF
ncbi:phosphomannomutase/phosphoglucomutase [Thiomicrospira sp. S5]|uniref:phosphomannomutase/phosphoglucomutase n=1 Tax=Thiomicrospira sp. S5 TaxID=1803865 RepID=UPI000F8A0311|nr:phosphomannomutase/phosphoglucomutase [Thiomicrospira sp. S5]AZR81278.1 phosphoglucomutase [Thiomicrospira sp. S5]AZR81447.1 phosphoglucomutase [Thiomicrospira sp. S5]